MHFDIITWRSELHLRWCSCILSSQHCFGHSLIVLLLCVSDCKMQMDLWSGCVYSTTFLWFEIEVVEIENWNWNWNERTEPMYHEAHNRIWWHLQARWHLTSHATCHHIICNRYKKLVLSIHIVCYLRVSNTIIDTMITNNLNTSTACREVTEASSSFCVLEATFAIDIPFFHIGTFAKINFVVMGCNTLFMLHSSQNFIKYIMHAAIRFIKNAFNI